MRPAGFVLVLFAMFVVCACYETGAGETGNPEDSDAVPPLDANTDTEGDGYEGPCGGLQEGG